MSTKGPKHMKILCSAFKAYACFSGSQWKCLWACRIVDPEDNVHTMVNFPEIYVRSHQSPIIVAVGRYHTQTQKHQSPLMPCPAFPKPVDLAAWFTERGDIQAIHPQQGSLG